MHSSSCTIFCWERFKPRLYEGVVNSSIGNCFNTRTTSNLFSPEFKSEVRKPFEEVVWKPQAFGEGFDDAYEVASMNLKFWFLIGLLEFRHRLNEEPRHVEDEGALLEQGLGQGQEESGPQPLDRLGGHRGSQFSLAGVE